MAKNFENDSFLLVHGTGDGKLGHIHRGLMLGEEEFSHFVRENSKNTAE